MTAVFKNTSNDASPDAGRSPTSLAFQRAWEAIEKTGPIPDKAQFRAERFAAFLPIIFLLELNAGPENRLIVRLAGERFRSGLGLNPTGENYIDYVTREHRPNSGASLFSLFDTPPRGRWVQKTLVHGSGFRQDITFTQFPMISKADGQRFVIGIAEGIREDLRHAPDGRFHFENGGTDLFIDIDT
ncbi:hypothetical protein [Parvibaculum sp. MBR-TMA-1.3b-4.2]